MDRRHSRVLKYVWCMATLSAVRSSKTSFSQVCYKHCTAQYSKHHYHRSSTANNSFYPDTLDTTPSITSFIDRRPSGGEKPSPPRPIIDKGVHSPSHLIERPLADGDHVGQRSIVPPNGIQGHVDLGLLPCQREASSEWIISSNIFVIIII